MMRSEILGLLVNTLTANYKYSCSNRENLQLPIQIKLSKNPSILRILLGQSLRISVMVTTPRNNKKLQ